MLCDILHITMDLIEALSPEILQSQLFPGAACVDWSRSKYHIKTRQHKVLNYLRAWFIVSKTRYIRRMWVLLWFVLFYCYFIISPVRMEQPWRLWVNRSHGCTAIWWRHPMETFFELLALCAANSPVTGEFPAQRPVTRGFGVSLIWAWINDWANNREAGDLRRHHAHDDVNVMELMIPSQ